MKKGWYWNRWRFKVVASKVDCLTNFSVCLRNGWTLSTHFGEKKPEYSEWSWTRRFDLFSQQFLFATLNTQMQKISIVFVIFLSIQTLSTVSLNIECAKAKRQSTCSILLFFLCVYYFWIVRECNCKSGNRLIPRKWLYPIPMTRSKTFEATFVLIMLTGRNRLTRYTNEKLLLHNIHKKKEKRNFLKEKVWKKNSSGS